LKGKKKRKQSEVSIFRQSVSWRSP
jgi:hypothetical protein